MSNVMDIAIRGIDGKLYVIDNGDIVELIPITQEKYDSLTEEEKMNDKFYCVINSQGGDNNG